MDSEFLKSQLLLMSNIAQNYLKLVPQADWLRLLELAAEKRGLPQRHHRKGNRAATQEDRMQSLRALRPNRDQSKRTTGPHRVNVLSPITEVRIAKIPIRTSETLY